MREVFLHYLWRRRCFNAADLRTTEGQTLEILHPGEYNTDAGPDFYNARVRLGETLWAGNVEMHLRASEWRAHRHAQDPAYANVVLHVVLDEDEPALDAQGRRLPCLSLAKRVPPGLLDAYWRLEHSAGPVPCAANLLQVPEIVRLNWLDRMLVERLEQKTALSAATLQACGNDWEETCYRLLARTYGLKVNTEAMESLAQSLPLRTLYRHRDQLPQMEALLFGQSGLLPENPDDEYPKLLAREYRHLQHKYGLQPGPLAQWKFLRLRPAAFPTLRLAQFAALLYHRPLLFSNLLEVERLSDLEELLAVPASLYWHTHYHFGKTAALHTPTPGRDFIHLLLVNMLAPMLFYYGKQKHQNRYCDQALHLLDALPAEDNKILREWKSIGWKAGNAAQAQAMLHLYKNYCTPKRCLECAVGNRLLTS
ncbi:MAG: DUF2851 family protein [Chitinophagales bacterium]|nr:DUF2851 family protein [Chitinophagales bacterium]